MAYAPGVLLGLGRASDVDMAAPFPHPCIIVFIDNFCITLDEKCGYVMEFFLLNLIRSHIALQAIQCRLKTSVLSC